MSTDAGMRTGGQVLADQLKIHDVDTAFCVPGESYLALIDALHDASNEIKVISCRQEGGATNMAEAYGKLTGKPGIAMVTRAPGACNGSVGVHTAMQDSTPMVILIGQVARDQEYREAFQEVDYRQFYGALCKWVGQIETADRIPEMVSKAFHHAMSGRPGPVALALPEDMLRDLTDVADAERYKTVRPGVDPADIAAMQQMVADAQRPLMIVGGGGWTEAACADILAYAAANDLPVAASFRCQDIIDNNHDCYAGELGTSVSAALAARVKEADLLLVVGARLGEMTTSGYSLVDAPRPKQKLIHIYSDPDELGRVYQADLPLAAGVDRFAAAACKAAPVGAGAWADWRASARQDYLENLKPTAGLPGPVDMTQIMAEIQNRVGDNAIITTDAGNFSGWPQRYFKYTKFPSQVAPTSGAMGYSVPAAIAARQVCPNRPVIGFVGDGGFMMSGQEFATAMHYGIDPVIIVVNNNAYGTIRMHQERDYPDRTIATALTNPDFAKWAESFGAFGATVERTEDFAAVFDAALGAGRIALIEIRLDVEVITTRTTLSAIRDAGRARRAS
ncbi:MAG: thiamine pyrophosphate-binding protein [Alphaproteobacteria bacterium]|nr:thiamine pyrophosphate-binding protein [Alphaproteobacteria bacterium]